jgi:signal transduction histidine kinase
VFVATAVQFDSLNVSFWFPHREAADRKTLRTHLLVSAVLIFGGSPLVIADPVMFITLVTWSALMAAAGLSARETSSDLAVGLSGLAASAVSSVGFFVVIFITGGSHSSFYPWLYAFPLALTLFARGSPASVLAIALVTGVFAPGLALYEHRSASEVRHALLSTIAVTSLTGLLGSFFYRMRRDQKDREQERLRNHERDRRSLISERMAVIGQLAAGVAHEVNNPLAFVKANLRFLREEASASDPEIGKAFDETLAGVERIQQIVSDLRSFSREDAEVTEPCRLEDVITESVRLASVRLKPLVTVKVETPADPTYVKAGPQRLSQVLVNLLMNAADALEEVKGKRPPTVRVIVTRSEGRALLAVEDNGPGIPLAILEKVFEPFYTTKAPGKGTGLGLSLGREYLAHFGGTLRAENLPGGGARMVVDLPLSPTPGEPQVPLASGPSTPEGGELPPSRFGRS